jgi:cutinase
MIRRSKHRGIFGLLAAAVVGAGATVLLPWGQPIASAVACPDIEVVFARGTTEPAGPGFVGQDFTDLLRAQVGNRTVDLYPVNYPAIDNWPTGVIGVNDASARIRQVAADCPKTKVVLGGFSQGAAVAQIVTADADGVPPNSYAFGQTTPLAPDVADRVAAVALFGKPNARFLGMIGQPNIPVGDAFTSKTISMCAANDPICSDGLDFAAHNSYPANGMVQQAVEFVTSRI